LWAREIQAVAVVAHWRHGRLDRVGHIAEALPGMLSSMLPSAPAADYRFCGVLLLAVGAAEIARGATATGVRMVALADRFGFSGTFQHTLSADQLRDADRPAYTAAVAEYAGLGQEGLRAAALGLLSGSGRD
jgi:hypothetical protein